MRNIGSITVIMGLVLLIGGCVDVDQPNVSTVDYRTFVRFVNFADSSMSLTVDGSSVASALTTGSATSYIDLPAGSRKFIYAVGSARDTFNVGFTPDSRSSYFVSYEPGNTKRLYVKSSERDNFEVAPGNAAVVRVVAMSKDTAASISGGLSIVISYTRTDTAAVKDSTFTGVTAGTSTNYVTGSLSAPVRYTVVGAPGDTLHNRVNAGIAGAGRYTIVLYGTRVSPQSKVLKED
jgi:hypothetical protein